MQLLIFSIVGIIATYSSPSLVWKSKCIFLCESPDLTRVVASSSVILELMLYIFLCYLIICFLCSLISSGRGVTPFQFKLIDFLTYSNYRLLYSLSPFIFSKIGWTFGILMLPQELKQNTRMYREELLHWK